jgi:hypothetical protein
MRVLRGVSRYVGAVAICTSLAVTCAEAKLDVEQVCQDHFHDVETVGKKRILGIEAAIEAWYFEVKDHDGYQWAQLPDDVSVPCNREPDGWHCRLKRVPCRYLPVSPPAAQPVPRTVPAPVN